MADISMCNGQMCPLKNKCYRYTAPKSKHWQSYMAYDVNRFEKYGTKPKCDDYWDDRMDDESRAD